MTLQPPCTPSLVALRPPPPFALSRHFDTLSIDAPKRKKADAYDARRHGHYGYSNDSSEPLVRVVLSRMVQSRDDEIVAPAATRPVGAAFLSAIKAATRRLALSAAGGATASFDDVSINILYNQSASTINTRRLYEGASLSLPGKLPWDRARTLVHTLLEVVSNVRASTPRGRNLGALLLRIPPAPLDVAAQNEVAAVVGLIETEAATRLSGGGGGGGSEAGGAASSSAASTNSTSPPPQQPNAVPVQVAAEPFAIDPTSTLRDNILRLVQSSLGRPLDVNELGTLYDSLENALLVLQAGGVDAVRQLLTTGVLQALVVPSASFVWSLALETAESGIATVAEYGAAIEKATGELSSVLFAAAFQFVEGG